MGGDDPQLMELLSALGLDPVWALITFWALRRLYSGARTAWARIVALMDRTERYMDRAESRWDEADRPTFVRMEDTKHAQQDPRPGENGGREHPRRTRRPERGRIRSGEASGLYPVPTLSTPSAPTRETRAQEGASVRPSYAFGPPPTVAPLLGEPL